MSILVVGSVAYDSIETPHGKADMVLGGAATYFALSASNFTDVRVIAVVGENFGDAEESVLTRRGVDTAGVEHVPGKCFHWSGSYGGAMNEATTLSTCLNVFADFEPKIPASYKDSDFLFLANIDPQLQARVRDAMPTAKLVCGDTMNFWIGGAREALETVLRGLDVLIINDGEARQLSDVHNLVEASEKILALGPEALVVKHGEYGATAYFSDRMFGHPVEPFRAPALALREVVDPTGAGDSFAGGFYGFIASQPELTPEVFRRALFFGGVLGSFAVERFGTERLQTLTRAEIDERFRKLVEMSHLADAAH